MGDRCPLGGEGGWLRSLGLEEPCLEVGLGCHLWAEVGGGVIALQTGDGGQHMLGDDMSSRTYALLLGAVVRKVDAELTVHDLIIIEIPNC